MNKSVCEIITDYAIDLIQNAKSIKFIESNSEDEYIPISMFRQYVDIVKRAIKNEEQEKTNIPIKKFLFIEDGSVDLEELKERIANSNPEIYIVLYRQGSNIPKLVDNS